MQLKDNIKTGVVFGFLAPFFGFFLYYLLRFRLFTVKEFFQVLMMQKSLLSGIISLALIVNVIVFTLFINKQKDKIATGVFIITCVYAVIALIFKWFF